MNNRYKVLLKDTFIFALGNLGSKIILFLLVPLYTNYLTKAEYGVADLVTSFSQLIIPFVTLVINEAVIRFALKKYEKKENVLFAAFIVLLFASIFTFLLMPIVRLYKPIAQWRWELAILVILSGFSETEKAYLKAINRNKYYSIISVMQTFVLASCNLYLLKFCNAGVKGYITANNLALAFTTLAGFLAGDVFGALRQADYDKSLLKRMIVFSSPLILNNVSWWIIHSSDKIMIESMINASELGLYTAASKIPSLINVIISIFIQAWGISSIKEVEKSKDSNFFSNVFNGYTFIAFGVAILFTGIIKPFMNVYVGVAFREAWRYAPLLLTAAVFYAVSSYYGSVYSALQITINSMITTMICAFCNVFLNYVLIKMNGTWGAIIATVCSYFILAHIRMINIKKHMSIRINVYRYVLNCMILVFEAMLISMDYHITIVSLISVLLFIIINNREINWLIDMVLSFLRKYI